MKKTDIVDCGCAVFCELGVFSQAELELHGKETHELIMVLPQLREELEEGFKFTYEGDESLFLRIAQWTSRERKCCAWANFKLELGGKIVLTVYGGGEAGKHVLSQGFNDLVQHK